MKVQIFGFHFHFSLISDLAVTLFFESQFYSAIKLLVIVYMQFVVQTELYYTVIGQHNSFDFGRWVSKLQSDLDPCMIKYTNMAYFNVYDGVEVFLLYYSLAAQ